jgi:hypothetical protein
MRPEASANLSTTSVSFKPGEALQPQFFEVNGKDPWRFLMRRSKKDSWV